MFDGISRSLLGHVPEIEIWWEWCCRIELVLFGSTELYYNYVINGTILSYRYLSVFIVWFEYTARATSNTLNTRVLENRLLHTYIHTFHLLKKTVQLLRLLSLAVCR